MAKVAITTNRPRRGRTVQYCSTPQDSAVRELTGPDLLYSYMYHCHAQLHDTMH